jgi:serine protease Do
LPTVKLGNPAETGAGEWVVAIGSPFGFENSVTAGIVSAKSRTLPAEGYVPFIQTDVAVNPGNSGGPLFNLKGEVIGINSQIYSQTGGYQGVSFAVPIDVALKVERQLLSEGRVTRGHLGVGIQELSQPLAESFGLDKPAGALVDSVAAGGPAASAGIQAGDVIVRVNGNEVSDYGQLPALVADLKPGSNARLTVIRAGAAKDIEVKLDAVDDQQPTRYPGDAAEGRLGLAVQPVERTQPGHRAGSGGVLVLRATGPAARAGIHSGDVILAVNGQPVADPAQFRSLTGEPAKRSVALLIQRGDTRIYVPVDLS